MAQTEARRSNDIGPEHVFYVGVHPGSSDQISLFRSGRVLLRWLQLFRLCARAVLVLGRHGRNSSGYGREERQCHVFGRVF